jgi:hypothetical protein
MTSISIDVDKELAQTFFQASADDKRKLQFLLNMRLKELMDNSSSKSLTEIMDDMGLYAESQGMTPELLALLLDEK